MLRKFEIYEIDNYFFGGRELESKVDLINNLIRSNRYTKYLEIGVSYGDNFNNINCDFKVSVDPVQYGSTTNVMTSDAYFESLPDNVKFDIILVDGLHEYETCYRDINNSLKHLNSNGIIICHDMNPLCEECETGENPYNIWNGDVWKSFARVRSERNDIESCMIEDFDYGLGVIKFGHSEPITLAKSIDDYAFSDFETDKEYLMNTITLTNFLNKNSVVICAIAKGERDYIREWVKYHLDLGFDKIYLYDNNDINGERYDGIFHEYIANNKLEIRDVRGLSGQQCKCYNEFYKEGNFDWCAIIDIDEYIVLGKYQTIREFINSMPKESDAISLYWRCYGDNNNIYQSNEDVMDRFPIPMDANTCHRNHISKINTWVKTIYKSGFDLQLCEHFNINWPEGYIRVDSLGNNFSLNSDISYIQRTYDSACVNHYITKSLDEWRKCKLDRGHADVPGGGITEEDIENMDTYGWNYGFDTYFNYNEFTPDKVKYLNSYGYNVRVEFKPTVLFMVYVYNEEYYKIFEKYLNMINSVCTPKFIYTHNYESKKFVAEGNYNDVHYAVGDLDLNDLKLMCYKTNKLNNDINCIIHIGFPMYINDEAIQEYSNQLESLFGDRHRFRMALKGVINNNITYVPKGSLRKVQEIIDNCPGLTGNIRRFSNYYSNSNSIPDSYIVNNIFITPYKKLYDSVKGKEMPYSFEDNNNIIELLGNNILSNYHAFQCAYPIVFDNIKEI